MNRNKNNNANELLQAATVVDTVIVPSRISHGSVGHDRLHMDLHV